MPKEYSYPRRRFIAMSLVFIVIGLIPYGLLRDALNEGSTMYIAFAAGFSLAYGFLVLAAFSDLSARVIVTDEYLAVRRAFGIMTLGWDSIIEFGRYRSIGYTRTWNYYVRTEMARHKKIKLGSHHLGNVEDMILSVSRKARNARLVTLTYTAFIPLASMIKVEEWDVASEPFE